MDEKGEVVGLTEQLDVVRKDADYLFEVKAAQTDPTPTKPSFGNGNQNANASGGVADPALRRAFGL